MRLETVAVDSIRPYARNPRKNDAAVGALVESISQCGYNSPIVVDEDMVVLAGHTRLKAVKRLGWKSVPVIIVDRTAEQAQKYRLLDNKTGELAEWDFELLRDELEGLDFGALALDWALPDIDALDLDDTPGDADDAAPARICHCPKCGFAFDPGDAR